MPDSSARATVPFPFPPPSARTPPAEAPSARPHSIAIPRVPEVARPHSFPVIAVVAPVVGSMLIWALTRSPFALVFALLGPLVAIASVADARIQSRRMARRESARFDRDIAATRVAIARFHSGERESLLRAAPGAVGLTARSIHDPERWRISAATGVPVRLGIGRAPSAAQLDGRSTAQGETDDLIRHELERLLDTASMIDGVPIVMDARLGLGLCGPGALAEAVARGILMQLGDRLPPKTTTFLPGGAVAHRWVADLPHRSVESSPGYRSTAVHWTSGGETGVVAVAARLEDLPVECRVVVEVGAGRTARITRCPEGTWLVPLPLVVVTEFVSAEQSRELGRFLGESARILGHESTDYDENGDHDFRSLPVPAAASATKGSLACVFARSNDDGEGVMVDLVAHGPHAVVGGTTGSGKSELLVSWVLAMARTHPPTAVNFLLVDFKGGASFAPIRALPHVVGIVTDLDERTAHRAMLSVRAELRFRERLLAVTGARSIDEPGVDLPRLVIVVDEFAAMAADYPQLHELFADLAARGRSLGLHLVLCTQRPAGAIRDAVLANATLRLSLRVNNRADSVAVLGTPQAAELSGDNPGRAWISIGGDSARLVRVARATDDDVRLVIDRYPLAAREIRRPWCDELAPVVLLSTLDTTGTGIPFARVDLPEEQRQETARYEPSQRGSLLVIGAQGSGKSELFATLAAASDVDRLPMAPDEAWDAVEIALGKVRAGIVGPRLLLADDLDALIGRFGEEYQPTFVDRLVELARDGSVVGLQIGLSVRRISPALHTLAALCDERIVLRLGSRQDHLMAGGSATGFSTDAPPGAGEWRGSRIQVALRSPAQPDSMVSASPAVTPFDLAAYDSVIVVTTRVAEFTRRLRAPVAPVSEVRHLPAPGASVSSANAGVLEVVDAHAPDVVVGDPDGWQASWAMLGALRSRALIVFDRCSVAEFRAISGRRTLPPPIRAGADQCWALEPDGSVRRMLAPSA